VGCTLTIANNTGPIGHWLERQPIHESNNESNNGKSMVIIGHKWLSMNSWLPKPTLRSFLPVVAWLPMAWLLTADNWLVAQSQLTTTISSSTEQTKQESSPETLWEAARKGNLPEVERAIDSGVEVDAKTAYGATALSFAADRGHIEVVRYLLSKQANPNSKDTFYNATPMS